MTFGDVLIILGVVFGIVTTLWAGTLVLALLFRRQVQAAGIAVETRPGRTAAGGVLIAALAGGGGLALASSPNGLLKLIGIVSLGALLVLALLGSAGLATIAAERLRRMDRTLSPLAALGRASLLLIGAGLLPVAGWFALFPAFLLVSLGAGWAALRPVRRKNAAATVAVAPVVETPAPSTPGAL